MATVLTLGRIKAAIMIGLAMIMIFASGMFYQSTQADPQVNGDDLDSFFLEALQVDFVCASRHTGQDRLALSISIVDLIESDGQTQEEPGFCRPNERLRLTLSLNGAILAGV